MLRRCGWIALLILVIFSVVQAGAFSGLQISNNVELAENPSAFWSRTIVFNEEFQSLSTNLFKLSRGRCYQVKGKQVTFYVPQEKAGLLWSLFPGDRISVGAVIQNERQGLVIFALNLDIRSFTLRVSSEGGGQVTPAGVIKVERGDRAEFKIKAEPHGHIDEVLVDGEPAGEFGLGSSEFSYAFENIGSSHSLEAIFSRDQFMLSVESDRGMVSPVAGSYPFEYGREVFLKIDRPEVEGSKPGERFVCRGWVGTGDVPAKGSDPEARFTITQASTLKWLWEAEYELALGPMEGGKVRGKPGWLAEGREVKLTAVPDEDFVFAGWEGDVPAGMENDKPLALVMDSPRTVSAKFRQNFIEVESVSGEHGRIEPEGRVPAIRGRDLLFSVTADPHYHIDQLLLDGRPVPGPFGPGKSQHAYTLKAPAEAHRLEASFAPDPVTLKVTSRFEGVAPAPGLYSYAFGEPVVARGSGAVKEGERHGARHLITGWKGGGDVPAQGEGLEAHFTLEQASTLEWTWKTEYLLEVKSGVGGQVAGQTGWFVEGQDVTVVAQNVEGMRFSGWTGDVPTGKTRVNPLALVMDKPRSVSANFEGDTLILRARSDGSGTVEPSGDVTVVRGQNASFSVTAAPHYHLDRILADGQSAGHFGQGSNAVVFTFTAVTNAHSLEAFFAVDQHDLLVASAMPGVVPPPGRHRMDAGDEVTARVLQTVVYDPEPGRRAVLAGWQGLGDIPPSGTGNELRVLLTQDSKLAWIWAPEFELKAEAGEGGTLDGSAGWHREKESVPFKAVPLKGYKFREWQGDVHRSDLG
ncbi:MAG: hypothetical protein V2A34_00815, partial [Lentisphaerota bacterium]